MKVKHVLKDLGPKTLVQIYKPSSVSSGYVERFLKAYPAEEINYMDYSWVKSDLDKDVDHVEYSHYYTADDMVASCDIYLKSDLKKTDLMSTYGAFAKEKSTTIDYADLKKKWDRFCKQFYLESPNTVHVVHINTFFELLSNGELVEMEDKDLS